MKVSIFGACGRMGSEVIKAAARDSEVEVVGALECPSHKFIGRYLSQLFPCELNLQNNLVKITDNPEEAIKDADVVIDFTTPDALIVNLEFVLSAKKALVVGTTGLSDAHLEKLHNAGKIIPLLLSPNMSLGANILYKLTEIVSHATDYDIDIVEIHHTKKRDAPSGTAKHLGECVKKYRKSVKFIYGRSGERESGEVGIFGVRIGDVVGEHIVYFGGEGEVVELVHRVHSRACFAKGALAAAKFVYNKPAGFYTMQDLLKI